MKPIECLRCGRPFVPKHFRKDRPAKYCSVACTARANGDAAKSATVMELRRCLSCGREFPVSRGNLSQQAKRKYCGHECAKVGASLGVPKESVLRDLYERQRLTTRVIGERYGVRHITIRRWLTSYGIALRAPGRGLAHRGLPEPNRDDLHRLVHVEHRPYREIAAMYGVDGSAVMHWLKRHEIPTPSIWDTRRKGIHPDLPTADEVRSLYSSGLSVAAIADLYGIGNSAIYRICDEHGIERRDPGWRSFIACADGHSVRSTYEQRVCDWLHARGVSHTYEPGLPFGGAYLGDFAANGWYIEIWGVENNAVYNARRERKLALYREYGLPLIELERWHFASGRKTLANRLSLCLTPAGLPLFPETV
jgi:hypothetical protein